ncbi:MAG: pseudouridine synthase [Solidesulfovibrio sp.]
MEVCFRHALVYDRWMQDAKKNRQIAVAPECAGWRLDRAVGLLVPEAGLRGRRRLIESGLVLVDGRPRGAAYRVRVGEMLAVADAVRSEAVFQAADVPVLVVTDDYAAVAKPAGLHSAALAHGGGQSLEALLPEIFPGQTPILLSRLDRLTSGLVPLAFSTEAAEAYRRMEDAGAVAKTYLAVAHGPIEAAFTVVFGLDVNDRVKTRVQKGETADPLRHTAVFPLEESAGLVLVRCHIAMGARHQIRAHLAASGHPLVGDPLYGRGEGARLYLHCAALRCPVLTVDNTPPWSLADATETVGTHEAKN